MGGMQRLQRRAGGLVAGAIRSSVLKILGAGDGLVFGGFLLPAIARPQATHGVGSLHFAAN